MAIISPNLAAKHLLVLLMDGIVVGAPQNSPLFSLKNIDRGEHNFIIKVISQNGQKLASSPPRKIYLHRSIVNPKKTLTPLNAD